jgi:hypothetical protein
MTDSSAAAAAIAGRFRTKRAPTRRQGEATAT